MPCPGTFGGCSGEPNRLVRFYYSGDTEDLKIVIEHALQKTTYQKMALIGFSIGGNMTLKYLGEQGENIPSKIKTAVTLSVPCDLASAAKTLALPRNKFYMARFLRLFRRKLQAKAHLKSPALNLDGFHHIKTFHDFDNRYTAPIHGFKSALDYYQKSSSKAYLSQIKIPTLLLNAQDDPFLSPQCFPFEETKDLEHFSLEAPPWGGHVGFVSFNEKGEYWSEQRTLNFLEHF